MKETLPEKPKKSPWRFVCLGAAAIAFLLMMWDLFIGTLISGILTGANESVGIIGGADGPTAIFVTTTTTGPDWEFILFAGIFILGLAGYFRLRRGRK
jgi:Na+-transporting methylmalonyl-CoA/oxaloacetate decarboxylase beta subunit